MNIKEKIVNGVLCYREFSDTEYIQFTKEALSTGFMIMKRERNELQSQIKELKKALLEIQEPAAKIVDVSTD